MVALIKIYYRIKRMLRDFWSRLLFRKDWEEYMTRYRRESAQLGWTAVRSAVTAADTALTASTKKYADLPSHAFDLAPGMNVAELRFMSNGDDQTADADAYVVRKNDDFTYVGSFSVTSGGQRATKQDSSGAALYYADTVTITDKWIKDIADGAISIPNQMARVAFDVVGYSHLLVFFTAVTTGHEWYCDVSGV